MNFELYADKQYFAKKIIKLFLEDSDNCSICLEEFSDNEPIRFLNTCFCKCGYHYQCILREIEIRHKCPYCRKPCSEKNIVNFKSEYIDYIKYSNIYNQVKIHLYKTHKWLYFINNWISFLNIHKKIPENCILNVYDFYDFTLYNPYYTESYELFNIKDPNKIILNIFYNPNKKEYIKNDKTLRPFDEFIKRFHNFTQNLFVDFKWNNIIIAGGSINKLLGYTFEKIPKSTDIDIFIYGTEYQKKITTEYLINFLKSKFHQNIYFVFRDSVINIYIPNNNLPMLQIIISEYTEAQNIIYNFDIDYVKVFLQNNQVFCTPSFLASYKYQITSVDYYKITHRRLKKISRSGFNLLYTENITHKINYFYSTNNPSYFPNENESPDEIKANISYYENINSKSIITDTNLLLNIINFDGLKNKYLRKNKNQDETLYLDLSMIDESSIQYFKINSNLLFFNTLNPIFELSSIEIRHCLPNTNWGLLPFKCIINDTNYFNYLNIIKQVISKKYYTYNVFINTDLIFTNNYTHVYIDNIHQKQSASKKIKNLLFKNAKKAICNIKPYFNKQHKIVNIIPYALKIYI